MDQLLRTDRENPFLSKQFSESSAHYCKQTRNHSFDIWCIQYTVRQKDFVAIVYVFRFYLFWETEAFGVTGVHRAVFDVSKSFGWIKQSLNNIYQAKVWREQLFFP